MSQQSEAERGSRLKGADGHCSHESRATQKLTAPAIVKEYADNLAELDSYRRSEMTWE